MYKSDWASVAIINCIFLWFAVVSCVLVFVNRNSSWNWEEFLACGVIVVPMIAGTLVAFLKYKSCSSPVDY